MAIQARKFTGTTPQEKLMIFTTLSVSPYQLSQIRNFFISGQKMEANLKQFTGGSR